MLGECYPYYWDEEMRSAVVCLNNKVSRYFGRELNTFNVIQGKVVSQNYDRLEGDAA